MSAIAAGQSIVHQPLGGPLTEADYAALAASWITREIVDAAMLRRVASLEGRDIVGQKGSRDCAGILFPYYWPGEPSAHAHRIRRDNPEWEEKNGARRQKAKYLAAPGSGNRLYIPPGVSALQLDDAAVPIAIVEGEKKALALWRLAHHKSERPRFIAIAIPGVWSWRGTVGKTGGPKGERLDVKGPITDLNRVGWKGRTVYVVFDANVHANESVNWARKELARELARRNAVVKLVNLPEDCQVNGIDDLLVAWGPEKVFQLFEAATSGARLHVVVPTQYESTSEGMFRISMQRSGLSRVQLTNFCAAIRSNVQLDDGVETAREFEIEAEIMGRKARFTLPASQFAAMGWPIERLGAHAIVYPNQKEYARTAIQSQSLTASEKRTYTHTGWRKLDGGWVYLHAGGAIAAAGVAEDVNVRPFGALSRYELRPPEHRNQLEAALRASLRLIELAPPAVSFPLYAAMCRSVFGGADFALHLMGETGAFKSELAALHQQHFGGAMDRLHLPGAWSSTANALEMLAFHAKDALLVIDDFAPQGSSADVARYHAAADRLFRAAGNLAGRSRLDSTARLREQKPPRALILSTGEEIPRGQSVRARLLILELSKGEIEPLRLSGCQQDARVGLYGQATAGFLQWFAGSYDELHAAFDCKLAEYRDNAFVSNAHARTPEIISGLQAAFEIFLNYCMAADAIGTDERDELAARCWQALGATAAAQSKHQHETEPTARFINFVRSLLSSGKAHFANRNGGEPDRNPGSCGWGQDSSGEWRSHGDCIGWADGDAVYLESTAAFRVVQLGARDNGEAFSISEPTLKKRLREKGLLASVDEKRQTLTIRRTICGAAKDVLHFHRSTVLPEPSDADEDAE